MQPALRDKINCLACSGYSWLIPRPAIPNKLLKLLVMFENCNVENVEILIGG